jgi:hypothetical protein
VLLFFGYTKFKNKSGVNTRQPEFSEEECERDYELKEAGLEAVLGKMHDTVYHAPIPYCVGGSLDTYLFPNHIAGTAFVSMELLQPDGKGPAPNSNGTYELIMFTKHQCIKTESQDTMESPFDIIVDRCGDIMTITAHYSAESGNYAAVLESYQTSTVPLSEDDEECKAHCFYHKYADFSVGNRKHHLLLIMEIFESELNYARQEGTEKLLSKLKEKGYYPYSDLDRQPVA